MTSSNTDYAKCILENIFLDENGKAENYWDYFDLCLADARKPYFFTQQNEFFSVKADYPNDSVKRLIPGLWFLQELRSKNTHNNQKSGNIIQIKMTNYFQRQKGKPRCFRRIFHRATKRNQA